MNWSAKILEKSEVSLANEITVKYVVLADGVETISMEATGAPADIQQLISTAVTAYAQAKELSDSICAVGEILEIVKDE